MDSCAIEQSVPTKSKGWVASWPLENYSTIHQLSLAGLMGLDIKWPRKHFYLMINSNMHTPLNFDPRAYLIFDTRDADKPPSAPNCCFSITQLTRWRMDISRFSCFEDYLNSLIRWHRCNFRKSEKTFKNYGCEVTLEEDWTPHVNTVYRLYCNVAKRYSDKLHNINFFKEIAQRSDYRLLCAWHQGKMIGMFLLQEELPTLHSSCCGFDYDHSTASYAYSWLHYELIRLAIESGRYHNVDVGLTGDDSKKMIGFEPIPTRMDIYTTGKVTGSLLRAASNFITAKITPESKLKLGLR